MKHFLVLLFIGYCNLSFSQNLPPVAVDDTIYYSFSEVHEFDSIKITATFMGNDSDPNGNTLRLHDIIYSGPNTLLPFNPTNQVLWLTYWPSIDFSGTETYQYVIRDNGTPIMYDTGTVTMIINPRDYAVLDANNIHPTVSKDVLFSSMSGTSQGFEAPVGSGVHSIFAANLWISGSNNGVTHSNLRDFGATHLSNSGPVSDISHTGSLPVSEWDRVWKVSKHQIDYHLANWNTQGYQPPQELLDWPAHGIIIKGEEQFLAPYEDVNHDTLYNPYDGDYPIIKGDQAIYFIYNDGGSTISISPMLSEVHGMAYAFSCQDSALLNTIFVDYKIYNRSQNTYDSTFVGMWSDMDIGHASDDYLQCDVMRNLYFMFNGDDFDDATGFSNGYENHPAAQGVVLLKGAKMDDDGTDNNFGIGLNETVNGSGFGDAITDNEHWGLERFMYYTNSTSANGDPRTEEDFNHLLKGRWKDGTSLFHGGSGHMNGGASTTPAKYMFPGTSDTYNYGTGGVPVSVWNEVTAGNAPGDRRGMGSTGPVTFAPGDEIELTFAFVFGRDYVNTGAQAGVTNMLERVDSIQSYYDQGMLSACGFPLTVNETKTLVNDITIYPNPTHNWFTIRQLKAQKVAIEVLDSSGRLIISKSSNSQEITIDLTPFSNGIYLIKINSEEEVSYQKVIKK
jgi:hypothetical protein